MKEVENMKNWRCSKCRQCCVLPEDEWRQRDGEWWHNHEDGYYEATIAPEPHPSEKSMEELADNIMLEMPRMLALIDARKDTEPMHSICLNDAMIFYQMQQQFIMAYNALKFVAPLRGKVVKINGFKFSHDSDVIKIGLDYEEVK